jgi:hypothetical protein
MAWKVVGRNSPGFWPGQGWFTAEEQAPEFWTSDISVRGVAPQSFAFSISPRKEEVRRRKPARMKKQP